MGLTIHYSLSTDLKKSADIRTLVETIRQFALDLPFKQVGELKDFTDSDADSGDESDRWLRIQAEGHVEAHGRHYRIPTKRTIAFSTWPGEGCEAANFGFSQYPARMVVGGKRITTKLKGWTWSSFCKTQYATNPACGGVENFIRCHLLVIKTLDFLKGCGLVQVQVEDEGGYWEQRDLPALVKEIGSWNDFLAAFTSELRAAAATNSQAIEAAITRFPNFEHLEARGFERLAKLRRKDREA